MKPGLVGVLVLLGTLWCGAQDDLGKRLDDIYRNGAYARALPGRDERPPPAPPEPERGSEAGRSEPRGGQPALPKPPVTSEPRAPFSSLLAVLPWIGVGAIVLLLVISQLRSKPRQATPPPAPVEGPVVSRADMADAEPPLSEARRLASLGRYAEAIHALLLEAITRLGAAARGFAPSLTSRELAATAAIPGPARDAFGRLVRAVEVSRFGGRPAGVAEFEACSGELDRIPA